MISCNLKNCSSENDETYLVQCDDFSRNSISRSVFFYEKWKKEKLFILRLSTFIFHL